jgi:hypothetical protein
MGWKFFQFSNKGWNRVLCNLPTKLCAKFIAWNLKTRNGKYPSMHIKVWHVRWARVIFCIENYSKIYDRQRAERSHDKNTNLSISTKTQCFIASFFAIHVCDCEAYTGKFITLKPVDQFLWGKVVSFKNENLYTGRLVSNVVTFVSFDMETLFYDEVRKMEWNERRPPGMSLTLVH